jgi:hypothetical protein
MSNYKPFVYKGNKNLKQAGVQIEWTPELIEEYQKCADDINYFIRKYVKIVHVDKGLIPFDMYDFQEDLIDLFDKNRFSIAMCPRQVGKSTIVCAYIIHYVLFNKDKNVAILANKHSTAKEIMYKLQTAYEHLPSWLQQGIVGWNKTDIELENGSRVSAAATSGSSVRGSSFNLIFLDEFAHIDDNMAKEFFASVYPTISSGKSTKIITVSTPAGLNHFHKMWKDAKNKRNNFAPYRVHWYDVPGRDDAWYENECKNLEEWQVRQEILCEFIGSSNTLISPVKLQNLVYEPPVARKPNLLIYEDVQKDHFYVCTVDLSEGSGGDYSVISVIDVTTLPYKHVAVYRTNEVSTILLPATLHSIATYYNEAHVLIELNFGAEVANSLHYDYEYENILHSSGKKFEKQALTDGWGGGRSNQLGVKMTKSVKKDGCSILKALIEHDKLITNDHETIGELNRFAAHRGSWAAENGNDDIVMTLVSFAWMTTQTVFKELTNTDVRRRLQQDRMHGMPEDLVPFGLAVRDGEPVFNTGGVGPGGKYTRDSDGTLWEDVETDDTFGWPVDPRINKHYD